MPMDTPDKPWTLEDYANFVFEFLGDEKQIHLIAHSFGARVAIVMETMRPGTFSRMLLTGAAGIPRRRNLWRWLKIHLHKMRIWKSKGSAEYRILSPNGKRTFQNIIKHDLRPLIKKIHIPTLLVYGSKDTATPIYIAKRWTRIAPNARLRIYKGVGHFCFIENPARFVSDALEWLKED